MKTIELTCAHIKPDDIRLDDELTFDYTRPDQHPPTRVGVVLGFVGRKEANNRCVVLYDYSLYDGPGIRSYRLDGLRNLSRIEEGKPVQSRLSHYRQALINFGKSWLKLRG